MSDFSKEYAKNLEASVLEFMEAFMPKEAEEAFRVSSEKAISDGSNVCPCPMHEERLTHMRLYPRGLWICDECAQLVFMADALNGNIILDTSKK